MVKRPFDGGSGSQRPEHRPSRHGAELRALPVQQSRVRIVCPGWPRRSEPRVDPGTDLLVDPFKERLHNGVPVIGPELVVDFGRGTDLIRGKPGITHASSVNLPHRPDVPQRPASLITGSGCPVFTG